MFVMCLALKDMCILCMSLSSEVHGPFVLTLVFLSSDHPHGKRGVHVDCSSHDILKIPNDGIMGCTTWKVYR